MNRRIRHGTSGKFSGPFYTGSKHSSTLAVPVMEHPFLTRAFWILAFAECMARFGVVNMKDGTGITAGLFQAVGCFPRHLNKQGPLFKLLWRMDPVVGLYSHGLGMLLDKSGWVIAEDGTLRVADSGALVRGRDFRDVVTPLKGRTPRQGRDWATARTWCEATSEVFSQHGSFHLQEAYGIEVLAKRTSRFRAKKYCGGHCLETVAFAGNIMNPAPFHNVEADLAHALMLSFMINAPAHALKAYERAVRQYLGKSRFASLTWVEPWETEFVGDIKFARILIRKLTSVAKRWDDDKKNSRYQRSRDAAMQVWPKELFRPGAVMAEDLPG